MGGGSLGPTLVPHPIIPLIEGQPDPPSIKRLKTTSLCSAYFNQTLLHLLWPIRNPQCYPIGCHPPPPNALLPGNGSTALGEDLPTPPKQPMYAELGFYWLLGWAPLAFSGGEGYPMRERGRKSELIGCKCMLPSHWLQPSKRKEVGSFPWGI